MASLAEVPKTQACRMAMSSWPDISEKSGHLLTSTMTGLFWVCRVGQGDAGGGDAPGGDAPEGDAPEGSQGAATGANTGASADGLRMGVALQLLLTLLTLDTEKQQSPPPKTNPATTQTRHTQTHT